MAKKFGARKDGKYKVVGIAPSVNLTQVGNAIVPIPYKVQQKLSSGKKVSDKSGKKVNFNGKPVYLKKSNTGKVKGDGKGSKKGIKSGTVEGKSEPLITTPSVRIYKQQLIRVKDMQYMQSKNTLGKVQSSEKGNAPAIKDNGEIEQTDSPATPKAGGSAKNKPTNNTGSGGLGSRTGSPVLLKTGQLFIEENDGQLTGQIPLTLERSYISGRGAGMFGEGWRFAYEQFIVALPGGGHALLLADGREFRFSKTESGYQDIDNLGVSVEACVAAEIAGQHQLPQDGLGDIIDIDKPLYRLSYFDDGHAEYYQSGRLVLWADSNLNMLRFQYKAEHLCAVANAHSCGIKFSYNPQGQVIAIEDHSGRVWRYEYDRNGQLLKAYNPLGGARCYRYGKHLTELRDECGAPVLSVRYEEQGRVAEYTEGEQSFRYIYQQSEIGIRVTKTDQEGTQTFYGVDSFGAIFAITHPDGSTEKEDYDEDTCMATVTDRVGNTHSKGFDSRNRLVKKTDSAGQTTTFDYTGDNPYPVKITQGDQQTQLEYDERFNLIQVILPDGSCEAYEYDTRGNRSKLIDALGAETLFEYNALGLPTRSIDAKGNHTTWEYDPLGRINKTTQADGTTQGFKHDARDRLVSMRNPAGENLSFRYTPTNQPSHIIDTAGNTTCYTYDNAGHPTKEIRADGRERHFTWNAQGQLAQVIQADGSSIHFAYDKAGHLKRKTVGDDITEYTFDAHGHLHEARNANETLELYYHKSGGLQTETQNGIDIDTAYNEQGVKIMQACLGDYVGLKYDVGKRLTTLRHSVSKQIKQHYDKAGRLTERTYPNQTQEQSQYDELAQLINHNTAEHSIDYRYDFTGRITQKGDTTYHYDALGRLIQAGDTEYQYDSNGNLQTDGASYNAENNQLLETENHTFTYYQNGQLRSKEDKATQQSTLYIYNIEGQLTELHRGIKAQAISESFFFKYDALGRRIEKLYRNETGSYGLKYLYSGHNIVALLDEKDELLARITHDETIDIPVSITTFKPSPLSQEEYDALCIDKQYLHDESLKTSYFYHRDHQGSIIALTDEDGEVVESYEYDAYGNTTRYLHKEDIQTYNPYAYTGREYDAPDLYYYRARYYDPTLKRFISEDPIGFVGGDTNWYNYANNDPIGFIDPMGMAKNPCTNKARKARKAKIRTTRAYKPSGARTVARGVQAAIGVDLATPEPTDAFWPKLVAEVAVAGIIEGVLWLASPDIFSPEELAEAMAQEYQCEKKKAANKKNNGIKSKGKKVECGDRAPYKKQKSGGHKGKRSDSDKVDKDHLPSSGYVKDAIKNKYSSLGESIVECMQKEVHKNLDTLAIPHDVHKAKTKDTGPHLAKDTDRAARAEDLHQTAKDEANVVEEKLKNKRGKSDPCAQAVKKALKHFRNLPTDYFDKLFKAAKAICSGKLK